MVSVCGVVVATIALVCALSVYNGFNDLVSSLFGVEDHASEREGFRPDLGRDT